MSEFSKTPRLVLLPAVDVAGGKAVRLTQGEAGTETNYGDPVDAASDWAEQGAEWIHLVDLDAAFGRGSNAGVLKKVIRQVRGVNVELSGGIRDDRSLEHALEIGAKRINRSLSRIFSCAGADSGTTTSGCASRTNGANSERDSSERTVAARASWPAPLAYRKSYSQPSRRS